MCTAAPPDDDDDDNDDVDDDDGDECLCLCLVRCPVCTAAPPCHNGDGGDDGDCDDHHDKEYYDYSNAYFEPVSHDKIFVDVVNKTTAWLSTVHHTSQTESEKIVFLLRTPEAPSRVRYQKTSQELRMLSRSLSVY